VPPGKAGWFLRRNEILVPVATTVD